MLRIKVRTQILLKEGGVSKIHNKKSFQGTESRQWGDYIKPFLNISFSSVLEFSTQTYFVWNNKYLNDFDNHYFPLESLEFANFGLARLLSRGAGPLEGG